MFRDLTVFDFSSSSGLTVVAFILAAGSALRGGCYVCLHHRDVAHWVVLSIVRRLGVLLALSSILMFHNRAAEAQPANAKVVFEEDTNASKEEKKALIQEATKPKLLPQAPEGLDFQAPVIEFKQNTNEIVGKGGILLSEGGVQVQAEQGSYNTETKQGDISGNVLMTSSAGVLAAESAKVNVESETGEFRGLEFDVEDGGYHILSDNARKTSEFEFELDDSAMTTCRCPDGDKPWEIKSSSCHITQGGYAHSYGSKVYFEGLPVFYSPYLVFPVKNERASGILPPQVGVSSRDGFEYRQPIFLSIDESTGFTVTPFAAVRSRVGSDLAFEKVFSETHNLNAGILYSNESLRGDSLRGLKIKGLADPSIDTNRFGGFYKERWTSGKDEETPIEFIADGHYTSDNLMLREIPAPNIGTQQAQFLTSTALARGTAFSFLNLEGRSEYNQMLITPQELQFQRVPEVAASATETLRPFGSNPLGLKLVTSADTVATDFVRTNGYDGWRFDVHPKVAVPFHIQNFVRAQASVELHRTEYSLRETMFPQTPTPTPNVTPGTGTPSSEIPGGTPTPVGVQELEDSSSRTVPIFNYGMSTGVEQVYELERGNWFSKMVGLGARNEGSELTKLKHTVEPLVQYTYVPKIDQNDLPLFDQLDRFRDRSLMTYGFTSRLYGRFHEPYERTREIEELTQAGETIPMFDMSQSLLDFGRGAVLSAPKLVDTREGEIRELASFTVRQAWDDVQARQKDRNGFTDWNVGVVVSPSYYVTTAFDSNVSQHNYDFSNYNFSVGLRDDRDDVLRGRYNFVDRQLSQFEGNLELAINEQFRAGAYARYDVKKDEFIENQGLLRFINSCKCWSLDLGVGQRVNPDRKQVLLTFTFGGLGAINQGVGIPQ